MDPNKEKVGIEMKDGVPVSLSFDDVYFSKEGGWEESRYVFVEGNQIPSRLSANETEVVSIGELGFGTGLNLFVTLDLWLGAENPTSLEYFSLEGFPLPKETLLALNFSFPNKPLWTEPLLKSYEEQFQKWEMNPSEMEWKTDFRHPKANAMFHVHLYFGDVSECLNEFPTIDFWYLDGFSPSKNPKMWSEDTLSQLRSHSKTGTRFATFTAAGFIRRNLEGLGFMVQKQKGFGKKREMLTGILR
ncbi:tRNA (5-methylaminomethyl-2-thiouridine)(34)-methyltransferase MnmD [Leptospira levettii]|uniref:tRNA (5-methylaminomethyl-2-thiouridine)(34)-methyltransferase MnmD n=1 Tax=Leptospira levettii TaxID=2023178 RepID=A0AAW5V3F5_9LEPT|nr:tRNA (5-methylaminomethyl-2-thiouridine)(34)-methyltransferase MnmD [Leptospira levettii]MCW7464552.1 tRNA (5-methylaminomethyl-2-thiouridine)(34)-methyltransferase MnmD [Leptospira levettii]MCW7511264.1 tRNA (5-methylaminomethyl-2-thiouridine)(34)-methyltransferase MnmD [Leptospira levettii]MCW7515018.1 tRNA (5-methylaminomethyl-2-thiouridine)(34)-methyltransferase MnmD [Leptospira levettii]